MAVRRSVAAACLPLLAGLALTGCGSDDPEPIIDPQAASTSPTPSAPPSPSPTREPWEKRTKAGAVAFVEHWVEVFNGVARGAPTELLNVLSAPTCASCNNLVKYIEDVRADDGSFEGGRWSIEQVGMPQSATTSRPRVILRVRQAEQIVVTADEQSSIPTQEMALSFYLNWTADGWQVARYEALT